MPDDEQPQPTVPDTMMTACVMIEQRMDPDGSLGQYVSCTDGLPIITALGMLEYAKVQLLQATGRAVDDDGDDD